MVTLQTTRHTAHIFHVPRTQFFSCARGSRFLRVLKVIPSHPCFTAACLMHSCPHISLHCLPHFHPLRRPLLCCSILRRVHTLPALCKEGCALADWPNILFSQLMDPSVLTAGSDMWEEGAHRRLTSTGWNSQCVNLYVQEKTHKIPGLLSAPFVSLVHKYCGVTRNQSSNRV